MRRLPTDPRERDRRKQDLLLASGLARTQAAGAVDEIAPRADIVVRGVVQLRAWTSDPRLWMVGGAAGSALALAALLRLRSLRLLHWGLQGWRVWRIAVQVFSRPGPPA